MTGPAAAATRRDDPPALDASGRAEGRLPPVFFINLDKAVERRRFMERQAEALRLPLTRVPAVAAEAIGPDAVARLDGRWERPLTPAELGCFLSHRAVWREAAAGEGPVLVLEDDVMLSRRLAEALRPLAALSAVEFLNLESFNRKRFVGRTTVPVAPRLAVVRVYRDKSGSAAYLLWPNGARKLLDRAERGAAPVDAFLHGLKGLVSFQSEPALAMQLHVLEMRGGRGPISAESFIQVPRTRPSLRVRHLPFYLRRAATQVRLGGEHLTRLLGRRYRLVDIDDADFEPPDQSRS